MSNARDAQIDAGYEPFEQDFTLMGYPSVVAAHQAALAYAAELETHGIESWDLKPVFGVAGSHRTEDMTGYRLEWAEPRNWKDEPRPDRQYLVISEGYMSVIPQAEAARIARAIDMDDESGPVKVLTLGRDAQTLIEVRPRVDSYRKINEYAEQPFHYAQTDYETAEGEFAFTVTHTDH